MKFKIGDKVTIHDGSWAVLIDKTGYHKNAFLHQIEKSGTVIATNCRLPFGRWAKTANPIEGLIFSAGCVHNDLLVQTKDRFVFTSTRHVKLVPIKPKKYFVCVLGVKVEVTKSQYNAVETSENTANDCYTGTFDEEDWK